MISRAVVILAVLCAAGGAPGHAAQSADIGDYPNRPIRFVIGFLPGGVSDTIARIVSAKLSEQIAQRIIIDTRPGAGGAIGMGIVVDSNPDGYTWYLAQPVVTLSRLFKNKPPYDPVKALLPVSLLGNGPTIMVVNPSLPVASVKEVIAYAKLQPRVLDFGSSGVGSTNHMAGELFKIMGKIPLVHVAYKGAAANTLALIQGEIKIAFQPLAAAIPHVNAGRLKGIAVTGARRANAMPNLPTIAETLPGYRIDAWYGIMVPAETPRTIIGYLNRETNKVLDLPQNRDALLKSGVETEGGTPGAFAQLIKEDVVRWEKLVKDAGITFE